MQGVSLHSDVSCVSQGRFEASLFAPVIITVFTLALHSINLPFIGVSHATLEFFHTAAMLFVVQLSAAVVITVFIESGWVNPSVHEKLDGLEKRFDGLERLVRAIAIHLKVELSSS